MIYQNEAKCVHGDNTTFLVIQFQNVFPNNDEHHLNMELYENKIKEWTWN